MDWGCPNCLHVTRVLYYNARPPDCGPTCPECEREMQSLDLAPLPVLNLDQIEYDIFAEADTEVLPAF
jgi:hypothetical protein